MNNLIKPMKAHKYKPSKVVRPGFLQPKLNGLRAIWNGTSLNTYNLEIWEPNLLTHITNELKALDAKRAERGLTPMHYDGEIYVHGRSLQWINSRASVNRKTPHPEEHLIQFHIFDYLDTANEPFSERYETLTNLSFYFFDTVSPIQICPTYSFNSEVEEANVFKLCRKERYEGMIYRDATEVYGRLEECGNKENRWWKLMKRKFWEDMDAEIIGVQEGKGNFEGSLGSFVCLGENGVQFNVGTGEALTHEMRDSYWRRQDSIIGKQCKVVYEMLSDSGVPLKPTVEAVYE